MKHLEGRVAVVTGAGRGIGRAVAKSLAQQGAMVVVNNRSDIAQRVVDEIAATGGVAVAHTGDVGDRNAAEELINLAIDEWGRLDILVNNAGQFLRGTIADMSEQDFDDLIRVHLKGTFNTSQFAARQWIKQDYGRLINMISRAGTDGAPNSAGYTAAKAGMIGLTRGTGSALIGHNVTANCITPTAATRMHDEAMDMAREQFEKTGKWPSEVAEGTALDPANVGPLVVYLASEDAGNISGRVFGARGLRYTLYNEFEEIGSVSATGTSWDVDKLFEDFPRSLGEGLTPNFGFFLEKIDGPMLMQPAIEDSIRRFY